MKKSIFLKLVTALTFFLSCFNLAISSFVIQSQYSEDATIPVDKTSVEVIDNYIGSATNPYCSFVNLESAIRSANAKAAEGNTVNCYIRPNLDSDGSRSAATATVLDVYNQDIVLNSGVNLYLPYESQTCLETVESDWSPYYKDAFADSSSANVNKYRTTLINLNSSTVTINSGASLTIGGRFGMKGVCREYCEINLDSNSSIDCYGSLEAYGYIKEKNTINSNQAGNQSYRKNECDPYRFIRVRSTGTLKTIIALPRAGGWSGSTLKAFVYDNKILPFYQFEFSNLQTYTRFDQGCKMTARVRIGITNSQSNIFKDTECPIIDDLSTGNNALFKMSAGTSSDPYLSVEYCPYSNNGYSYANLPISKVVFAATVEMGYIKISVNAMGLTMEIDSSQMFLPISYQMPLHIANGGNFIVNQKLKFLNEANLTIDSGGRVDIQSQTVFFPENMITNLVGTNYSSGHTLASRLINNGTLKVSSGGKLGAFIETENNSGTALVDLSSTTSSSNMMVDMADGTNAYNVKVTSSGLFKSGSNTVTAQFVNGSSVTSDTESNSNRWVGQFNLTYTLNITMNNSNNYDYPVGGYKVYVGDANGSNSVELTSEYMTESASFDVQSSKYFKVDVTRAASYTFEDNSALDPSTWYPMNSIKNITIVPNEGYLLGIVTQGLSGAGGTTYDITEMQGSSTTYTETITSNATEVHNGHKGLVLVKNATVKVKVNAGAGFGGLNETSIADGFYTSSPAASVDDWKSQFETDNGLSNIATYSSNSTFTMNTHKVIYRYKSSSGGGGGCLLPDTLINMADGSKKEVKDIKAGDMLLIFNHETGRIDSAPVVFNDHEESQLVNVIRLYFSNGKEIGVISEHGFFDLDLMKYIYITKDNYLNYIGHRFYAIDSDLNEEIITLDRATMNREITECYSPTTYFHLDLFTDDILSMPGGIEGLFNIFEYSDDLSYDQEKKQEDIDRYGLFTYDDFRELMPEEMFNEYPVKYLKVALGKGLITWDRMYYLIERYGPLS